MTRIFLLGTNCIINKIKYPCIHTCSINIANNTKNLNDFILDCNTIPQIIFKKGFFDFNWNEEKKLLFQADILDDVINIDNFNFLLINFNKVKNWLALGKIYYKDVELKNVLHS